MTFVTQNFIAGSSSTLELRRLCEHWCISVHSFSGPKTFVTRETHRDGKSTHILYSSRITDTCVKKTGRSRSTD